MPLSFRLIVLDTDLLIKKSLNILIQNCTIPVHASCVAADVSLTAIVSAPLWDSETSRFAGILTATDFINVIQYYYQFPDEISKLDQFRLSSLRGRSTRPRAELGGADWDATDRHRKGHRRHSH